MATEESTILPLSGRRVARGRPAGKVVPKRHEFKCGSCGIVSQARTSGRVYCSPKCAQAHRRRAPSTCVICGKTFTAKRTAVSCCSQRCGWKFLSRNSREAKQAEAIKKWVEFLSLYPFLSALVTSASASRQTARSHRRRAVHRPCRICGMQFKAKFTGGCRSKFCGDACERSAKREHRRRGRRQRGKCRGETHRQRARRLGVPCEPVRRMDVFKRDGWRCQLCGRPTPRRLLRDFKHPAAPTLDHIIPMAVGGPHTWANVQCACRECNSNKSATPLGQQRMF